MLHTRTAEALEARFPEVAAATPEIVAHHLTEAGAHDKAAAWWHRAGVLAVERSATAEAAASFSACIAALRACPVSRGTEERELEARIALGGALIASKGYAAPETGQAFDEARELAQRLGRRDRLTTDPLRPNPIPHGRGQARRGLAHGRATPGAGCE